MNFRELSACTHRTLQGKYTRSLKASLLYGTVWLLLKLCPCVLAGILIVRGRAPRELLLGAPVLWVIFSALWALLRMGILLPLHCGTCAWFTALTGLERRDGRQRYFRSTAEYLRGLGYFSCVELLRFLALLPFVLGAVGATAAFRYSIGLTEGGLPLFLAAQCLCLALAGAAYYIGFCLKLSAVPFLYIENPHGSPFEAVSRSCRMLQGHRRELVLLGLGYLLSSLPLVTIPFLLPHFMTSCTLLLQIRMREWEQQEEEEIHANPVFSCGEGMPLHARSLSPR